MKKYLFLFSFLALILILLTGFAKDFDFAFLQGTNRAGDETGWKPTPYEAVNSFDGINMEVKEGSVSSAGLTVFLENKSNSQSIYGEDFELEKKINGRWYQVPVDISGDYGFNDIGYQLNPGEQREWEIDWQWLYGSLEPGEYRVVKISLVWNSIEAYDAYNLAAEFLID